MPLQCDALHFHHAAIKMITAMQCNEGAEMQALQCSPQIASARPLTQGPNTCSSTHTCEHQRIYSVCQHQAAHQVQQTYKGLKHCSLLQYQHNADMSTAVLMLCTLHTGCAIQWNAMCVAGSTVHSSSMRRRSSYLVGDCAPQEGEHHGANKLTQQADNEGLAGDGLLGWSVQMGRGGGASRQQYCQAAGSRQQAAGGSIGLLHSSLLPALLAAADDDRPNDICAQGQTEWPKT
jgi:hypothetical protein